MGYNGNEIAQILLDTDFSKFLDSSWGVVKDMYRLYNKFGYYIGDELLKFCQTMIEKKVHNKDITFQKLYELNKKEITLIATNITKDKIMYLNRFNNPDMSLALAIRTSMSIQFIYQPVIYKGDLLGDGGLSNNYPLYYFDEQKDNCHTINYDTIGLKFMGYDEKRNNDIFSIPKPITNIVEYSTAILNYALNKIERLGVKNGYWERTLSVPTEYIGMLDFKIPKNKKINIQKLAQKIAIEELDYFNKYKQFPKEEEIKNSPCKKQKI